MKLFVLCLVGICNCGWANVTVDSRSNTYTVDGYGDCFDFECDESCSFRKPTAEELGETRTRLKELPMNAKVW